MDEAASDFAALLAEVEALLAAGGADPLAAICACLREAVPHYDWVGFYLVAANGRELALGPYAGAPTEHVKIAFGEGICGQAAARKETYLAQDVSREPNYLACSLEVKSEIVVPIFHAGRLVGELDIDSHRSAPFTPADRAFCERVAALVSPLIDQYSREVNCNG